MPTRRYSVNALLTSHVTTEKRDWGGRYKDISAHEYIAESWEDYLTSGKAPTSKLQELFDTIAKFMKNIYGALRDSNEIPPALKEKFDEIVTAEERKAKEKLRERADDMENARVLFSIGGENPVSEEQILEAKRQYEEVVSRYKDTPQWMMEANGKPTKLNERQWVQVRTPVFKNNYFGDWERKAILEKGL